jgi:hypothetical protein
MNRPVFNRGTHFSIVWGVTLAVLTLVEWNSLDRDPLREEILVPFIQREVSVSVEAAETPREPGAATDEEPEGVLQYEVEFRFNGPLFLAYFFGPVLAFQGIGWLASRFLERNRSGG